MSDEGNEVDNVVEIEDAVEDVQTPEIDLSALDAAEKVMAEKQGIVETKKDAPEVNVEKTVEAKKTVVEADKNQTFEDTEKNEKDLLGNYSKNEQALYWKWKHDKKERQTAQAERDLSIVREKSLKAELEKIRGDHGLSDAKLRKINEILTGPAEEITVEALQAVINSKEKAKQEEDKDRPITIKDVEELQAKRTEEDKQKAREQEILKERLTEAEAYGKSNIENFDDVVTLSQQVLEGKVSLPKIINIDDVRKKLAEIIKDTSVPYEEVSEYIIDIAKLHPEFGSPKKSNNSSNSHDTKSSSEKKQTNENIDRILKNSSKQQTSASVGSGNGSRRVVSYDDLTVEDAARLSTDQWAKLPIAVRKRLLA